MSFMSYFVNFSGALYYTLSEAALCISGHILSLFLVNKHPDSPKRSRPLCLNLYVNIPAR